VPVAEICEGGTPATDLGEAEGPKATDEFLMIDFFYII
jgi:hypothetical protein